MSSSRRVATPKSARSAILGSGVGGILGTLDQPDKKTRPPPPLLTLDGELVEFDENSSTPRRSNRKRRVTQQVQEHNGDHTDETAFEGFEDSMTKKKKKKRGRPSTFAAKRALATVVGFTTRQPEHAPSGIVTSSETDENVRGAPLRSLSDGKHPRRLPKETIVDRGNTKLVDWADGEDPSETANRKKNGTALFENKLTLDTTEHGFRTPSSQSRSISTNRRTTCQGKLVGIGPSGGTPISHDMVRRIVLGSDFFQKSTSEGNTRVFQIDAQNSMHKQPAEQEDMQNGVQEENAILPTNQQEVSPADGIVDENLDATMTETNILLPIKPRKRIPFFRKRKAKAVRTRVPRLRVHKEVSAEEKGFQETGSSSRIHSESTTVDVSGLRPSSEGPNEASESRGDMRLASTLVKDAEIQQDDLNFQQTDSGLEKQVADSHQMRSPKDAMRTMQNLGDEQRDSTEYGHGTTLQPKGIRSSLIHNNAADRTIQNPSMSRLSRAVDRTIDSLSDSEVEVDAPPSRHEEHEDLLILRVSRIAFGEKVFSLDCTIQLALSASSSTLSLLFTESSSIFKSTIKHTVDLSEIDELMYYSLSKTPIKEQRVSAAQNSVIVLRLDKSVEDGVDLAPRWDRGSARSSAESDYISVEFPSDKKFLAFLAMLETMPSCEFMTLKTIGIEELRKYCKALHCSSAGSSPNNKLEEENAVKDAVHEVSVGSRQPSGSCANLMSPSKPRGEAENETMKFTSLQPYMVKPPRDTFSVSMESHLSSLYPAEWIESLFKGSKKTSSDG